MCAVMEICRQKIIQNSQVREALWVTEGYPIVLDTSDRFWGLGKRGEGKNNAGKIMMRCRDDFFRSPYALSQEEVVFAADEHL